MRSSLLLLPAAAALIAGCAVEAAPNGLGANSLRQDAPHGHVAQARAGAPNYVAADSRYGHGTVSGPVRAGRKGYEVRLPGGTWIDCARSCSETLRRETVDFWESRGGRNDPIDGPAYFRWSW